MSVANLCSLPAAACSSWQRIVRLHPQRMPMPISSLWDTQAKAACWADLPSRRPFSVWRSISASDSGLPLLVTLVRSDCSTCSDTQID